jgi:hypothetical protein
MQGGVLSKRALMRCRWIHRLPGTALDNRFTVATDTDQARALQSAVDDLASLAHTMQGPAAAKASAAQRAAWAHERAAWDALEVPAAGKLTKDASDKRRQRIAAVVRMMGQACSAMERC